MAQNRGKNDALREVDDGSVQIEFPSKNFEFICVSPRQCTNCPLGRGGTVVKVLNFENVNKFLKICDMYYEIPGFFSRKWYKLISVDF